MTIGVTVAVTVGVTVGVTVAVAVRIAVGLRVSIGKAVTGFEFVLDSFIAFTARFSLVVSDIERTEEVDEEPSVDAEKE